MLAVHLTRLRPHAPAADRPPHPRRPPPRGLHIAPHRPIAARQHEPQHPGPLGREHQPPPRRQPDPLRFGDHPRHAVAAKRFLHRPEDVAGAPKPRHDHQTTSPDPVLNQAGRVEIVAAAKPEEGAVGGAGFRVSLVQGSLARISRLRIPLARILLARIPLARILVHGPKVATASGWPPANSPLPRPRKQRRTETGGRLVPRHLVDAPQTHPAPRQNPVDFGDPQRQMRVPGRTDPLDATNRPPERISSVYIQYGHGAKSIPKKRRICKSNGELSGQGQAAGAEHSERWEGVRARHCLAASIRAGPRRGRRAAPRASRVTDSGRGRSWAPTVRSMRGGIDRDPVTVPIVGARLEDGARVAICVAPAAPGSRAHRPGIRRLAVGGLLFARQALPKD